jgi:hypothetical protein
LCELNSEGVSLYDHMTADLIRPAGGAGGVHYCLGYLEVASLPRGILRPRPLHIDNPLIKHSQCDVYVG